MKQLKELKNLGPTIINNLDRIGISTIEDLKAVGAVGVYKEITNRYPGKTWPVCYYLYSIEGALTNQHWNNIGKKKNEELLQAVGKA